MALKLYNSDLSPYATRARIAAYAKGIDVEMVSPADVGGSKSETYLAMNPIGKIPTLDIGGGKFIPESETIVDYFDALKPNPPLRPADPADRAKAFNIARIVDLYLDPVFQGLLNQMRATKVARDNALVDKLLADSTRVFGYIEKYLEGPVYAVGGKLSNADAALVPILGFFDGIFPFIFGKENLISPKLRAYFDKSQSDPHLGKAMAEMRPKMKARVEQLQGAGS